MFVTAFFLSWKVGCLCLDFVWIILNIWLETGLYYVDKFELSVIHDWGGLFAAVIWSHVVLPDCHWCELRLHTDIQVHFWAEKGKAGHYKLINKCIIFVKT